MVRYQLISKVLCGL